MTCSTPELSANQRASTFKGLLRNRQNGGVQSLHLILSYSIDCEIVNVFVHGFLEDRIGMIFLRSRYQDMSEFVDARVYVLHLLH